MVLVVLPVQVLSALGLQPHAFQLSPALLRALSARGCPWKPKPWLGQQQPAQPSCQSHGGPQPGLGSRVAQVCITLV